ncbi:Protein CBR-RFC-3 [Paramicrosporidium saccamoebae]|uniref:Protein CBR-RFC-3 n=1 Tax=Paramicrosporidium saccamoebae TaxID=1246581 RepID=A0A2H9TGK5_9FUNG|nr:Protein CBR-RFC-3 [Paramicrosporidium saccamoebae]
MPAILAACCSIPLSEFFEAYQRLMSYPIRRRLSRFLTLPTIIIVGAAYLWVASLLGHQGSSIITFITLITLLTVDIRNSWCFTLVITGAVLLTLIILVLSVVAEVSALWKTFFARIFSPEGKELADRLLDILDRKVRQLTGTDIIDQIQRAAKIIGIDISTPELVIDEERVAYIFSLPKLLLKTGYTSDLLAYVQKHMTTDHVVRSFQAFLTTAFYALKLATRSADFLMQCATFVASTTYFVNQRKYIGSKIRESSRLAPMTMFLEDTKRSMVSLATTMVSRLLLETSCSYIIFRLCGSRSCTSLAIFCGILSIFPVIPPSTLAILPGIELLSRDKSITAVVLLTTHFVINLIFIPKASVPTFSKRDQGFALEQLGRSVGAPMQLGNVRQEIFIERKEPLKASEVTRKIKKYLKNQEASTLSPSVAVHLLQIRESSYFLTHNALKIDERSFQTPSGRKFDVTVISSNFHVEINPSDVGIYDRVVVQDIVKELAQTQQLDKSKRNFKGIDGANSDALVVVILDADKLSRDGQHGLRRTMEKYSSNLRIILCCTTSSRIIDPIKSRCFVVRIPAPTDIQVILNVQISYLQVESNLRKICTLQSLLVDDSVLQKISHSSAGNYRRAVLSLEEFSQRLQ